MPNRLAIWLGHTSLQLADQKEARFIPESVVEIKLYLCFRY